MAQASIGALNVKIAADGKQFFNELAKAEKSMTAFAAKAASPLTMALGAGGGIAGAMGGSLGAFLGPLAKLADAIPGMEKFDIFLDPHKYSAAMKEVQESTLEIARAADRLNVDPQFLKALRLTAGPLADDLMPGLQKLLRFQGELRKGGEDVLTCGGRSAMTMAEKWGFDPQELANLTSEELLLKFADQLKEVDSQSERVAMAMDLMGKSGAKLTNVFAQGSGAIQKWLDLVKELGIDTPEQINMAKTVAQMEKLHKLRMEGIKDQEFMRTGGITQFYREKAAEAPLLSDEWFKNTSLYLSSLMPTLGVPMKVPPELQKHLDAVKGITEAPEVDLGLIDARTAADDATDAIGKLNDALDEQQELLRLTGLGWGGVEKQVLELSREVGKGGDVEFAIDVLERLAGIAKNNELQRQTKDLDQLQAQLTDKVLGLGGNRAGLYAPVDMAGSSGAAAAFNSAWTSGGGGDLTLTVQQILDLMKKPALSPEMQQRIREAATELQKLNNKLNPVAAVNGQ